MVDLSNRIQQIINQYIESGQYFTINRARQYGKTTLLYLLEKELRKQDYLVLSLSFEAADEYFESLGSLAEGLSLDIEECLREQNVDEKVLEEWNHSISERFPMRSLGTKISNLCRKCGKKVVLMIDEVDKSSDNQIFLSFLGLLREKYLKCQQGKDVTFHSVILAGVYDIKTLKLKLHPQEESKYNSPWNIAVDFNIEMSFSVSDIQTMIQEYEQEHRTGMDVKEISRILYDYTSGYPYLVSKICQLLDDGHITDSNGRKVDFKNTVIIMTSNAGANRIIAPKHLGFSMDDTDKAKTHERMKKGVMEEVKQIFRPEFLNRIDETIVFAVLTKEEVKKIAKLFMDELRARLLSEHQITLKITSGAMDLLADKGYDENYGARPLRRIIQNEIEDVLADKILEGTLTNGQTMTIGKKDKKLTFSVKEN